MNVNEYHRHKVISSQEAIEKIKTGSRIFIGTGCGEPQHLIHELVNRRDLQDIMIYQMLSFTLAKYVDDPSFLRRFFLKLFSSAGICEKPLLRARSIIFPRICPDPPTVLWKSNRT
jgi:hypothetical protein